MALILGKVHQMISNLVNNLKKTGEKIILHQNKSKNPLNPYSYNYANHFAF